MAGICWAVCYDATSSEIDCGIEAGHGIAEDGCRTVYIDGSFVTAKPHPDDFDGCWDIDGVDPERLDPVLLTFNSGRAAQKAKYLGELFPARMGEGGSGLTFLEFFQVDKETGNQKGIVSLELRRP